MVTEDYKKCKVNINNWNYFLALVAYTKYDKN